MANETKRPFKLLLYALPLTKTNNATSDLKIVPGLINRNNLFDEMISIRIKNPIEKYLADATPLFPELKII